MSDLFDQADNAVETKPEYSTWGQCFAEIYEAVWQKGARSPERYDPTIHKASDKFTRIEIQVIPLDEMNARFNAEFKGNVTGWNNREWASVVLPSLKAIGLPARAMNNAWVKITKKPNGKFYDKKSYDEAGNIINVEKKELTDFLFVKLFASQDACLADYLATQAGDPQSADSAADFPVSEPVASAPLNQNPIPAQSAPAGPSNDILLKFARAIVTNAAKTAGKDMAKTLEIVKAQLDTNTMLNGKYKADSAEVLEMVAEACQ